MTTVKTFDILQNILCEELELSQDRVFAYNNEIELPKDENIFIVFSYMSKTPYSNNIKYRGTVEDFKEIQTMNVAEDILISVMSVNTDARDRSHEVLMALKSTYSIYQQEKYKCHISTINEINDGSFLEASARLNRFDIKCRVFRGYDKIKDIDYYNKYPNTSKFEPNWYIDK